MRRTLIQYCLSIIGTLHADSDCSFPGLQIPNSTKTFGYSIDIGGYSGTSTVYPVRHLTLAAFAIHDPLNSAVPSLQDIYMFRVFHIVAGVNRF